MSSFRTTAQGIIPHDCRARAAMNVLLEMSPSFAALALWTKHTNAEPGLAPAYTDGVRIYYEPRYEKFTLAQQIGVLVHEILHVALMHPQRGRKLAKTTAEWNQKLWNIACDAVINESIKGQRWCALPDGVFYMSEIIKKYTEWCKAKGRPDPKLPAAATWSAESCYRFLVDWREDASGGKGKGKGKPNGQGQGGQGDHDEQDEQEQGGKGQQGQNPVDQMIEDFEKSDWNDVRAESMGDGPGSEVDANGQRRDPNEVRRELEGQARDWNRRMIRAQAGDRPGGVLRGISADLPTVDTPWETVLKTKIQRAIMPTSEVTPTRPSRRWMVLTEGGRSMDRYGFEAGVQHAAPGAKIGVLLDTSGSIYGDLLDRFAAEIEAIHKRTKTEMQMVVCDAAVHEVVRVPSGGFGSAVKHLEFRGGGGTDFRPAFAEIDKFDPDIVVFLTDTYGAFPERRPRYPVVWAVPDMNGAAVKVPFGTVIRLN